MTPQEIEALFTRNDGSFVFARWGRPVVPIVFGVEDQTLPVIKGAFEAVCAWPGTRWPKPTPSWAATCMVFFCRAWDELPEVPDLDRLVPGLVSIVERLKATDANQYRVFRFDEAGAIKAAFVFLRMDAQLAETCRPRPLALGQVVQTMLLWSDRGLSPTVRPWPIAQRDGDAAARYCRGDPGRL